MKKDAPEGGNIMKNTNSRKRICRQLAAMMCIVTAAVLCAGSALACTAVYVGAGASDDGTVIIAKSNDYQDVWPNYVTVVDHVDDVPGRTMPVDNGDTVFAPIPATTYISRRKCTQFWPPKPLFMMVLAPWG